jgi:hypothetical protein
MIHIMKTNAEKNSLQFTKVATAVLISLMGVFFGHNRALAALPPKQTTLDLTQVVKATPEQFLTNASLAKVIPIDMAPRSDEKTITTRILDQSSQSLLNPDNIKDESFKNTAATVQNAMNADIKFGSPEEGEIQHAIKFQFLAFQSRAALEYSGLLNARLAYETKTKSLRVFLSEKIIESTELSVERVVEQLNPAASSSRAQITFNWNW